MSMVLDGQTQIVVNKTTLGFWFSCIFYAGTGKGYVKIFGFRTLRIYNKLTRQAHHRIDRGGGCATCEQMQRRSRTFVDAVR